MAVLSRTTGVILAYIAMVVLVYLTAGERSNVEAPLFSSLARQGQELWHQRQCISCHSIYGLGGHLGPDLTNVIGRVGGEYVRLALQKGVGKMPAQKLTDPELAQMVAYLKHLQGTGVYPLNSLVSHAFGKGF